MRIHSFLTAAIAAASVLVAMNGCQPAVEEIGTQEPTNVTFSGKPDETLAGTWKSKSGNGTYQLNKDGTYMLDSVVRTPGGEMKTKSEGEWRIDGDRFLMKDAAGNVVPYILERGDNQIVLQVGQNLKHKTELIRQ